MTSVYFALPMAILVFHTSLVWDFANDDAWISFRYAQNLVNGNGLVFNPGEFVEGYTNFLWVMCTALGMWFGFDPVVQGKVLGILLALGTLILTVNLFSLLADQETPVWFRFLPSAVLALNICFAANAVSGMETMLFTFLLVLAATLYLKIGSLPVAALSGITFGLTSLTRPEGVAFFLLTALHIIVFRSGISRKKALAALVLGFLVIFVPYFGWRYNYYGDLFPNTFYAKVGGGIALAQWVRGATYVLRFLSWFYLGTLLFVVPVVYMMFTRKMTGPLAYILSLTLAYMVYLAYVGGDGLPLFRFAVQIAPFITILSVLGLYYIFYERIYWLTYLRQLTNKRIGRLLLAISILISPLLPWVHYKGLADSSAILVESLIDTSQWLKKNAGSTDVLAIPTVGIIPYYSGLKTIDMLGLTDRHIARAEIPTLGQFYLAGHEKSDPNYVFSLRPTYIWISTNAEERWIPGTAEIVELPSFLDYYEPVQVRTEKGLLKFYRLKEGSE